MTEAVPVERIPWAIPPGVLAEWMRLAAVLPRSAPLPWPQEPHWRKGDMAGPCLPDGVKQEVAVAGGATASSVSDVR